MDQEVPYSYRRKMEYEEKMEELSRKMNEEYQARREENARYALQRTKELVAEYKEIMRKEEEAKREAEARGAFYVPKEPEFYVVVRIRGIHKVPPRERKILELIRLKKPNHAVFVRNNAPMRAMLHKVRAYIAFGFADIHLLRTLVYKRGMAKVSKRPLANNSSVVKVGQDMRLNLTNEAIEDHFGGRIRCVEELIYQIYMGTDLFKKANNFLWPFTLCSPRKGFGGRKAKDVAQGGSTGCHYDKIGNLIYRMIE